MYGEVTSDVFALSRIWQVFVRETNNRILLLKFDTVLRK